MIAFFMSQSVTRCVGTPCVVGTAIAGLPFLPRSEVSSSAALAHAHDASVDYFPLQTAAVAPFAPLACLSPSTVPLAHSRAAKAATCPARRAPGPMVGAL